MVTSYYFWLPIPAGFDWIFIFVSVTAVKWAWANTIGHPNIKWSLTVLNLLVPLIVFEGNAIWVYLGLNTKFNNILFEDQYRNDTSDFHWIINCLGLVVWTVSWLSTSAWPWRKWVTVKEVIISFEKRAHALKLLSVVVVPHILWAQASNNANIAQPTELTFGQIFALIVSGVAVIALVGEARRPFLRIWRSAFASDVLPASEDEVAC